MRNLKAKASHSLRSWGGGGGNNGSTRWKIPDPTHDL